MKARAGSALRYVSVAIRARGPPWRCWGFDLMSLVEEHSPFLHHVLISPSPLPLSLPPSIPTLPSIVDWPGRRLRRHPRDRAHLRDCRQPLPGVQLRRH